MRFADAYSLMVAMERAFGVRFRIGEVENAKNVGAFADLFFKRQQKS
jgi:hypothetical protein